MSRVAPLLVALVACRATPVSHDPPAVARLETVDAGTQPEPRSSRMKRTSFQLDGTRVVLGFTLDHGRLLVGVQGYDGVPSFEIRPVEGQKLGAPVLTRAVNFNLEAADPQYRLQSLDGVSHLTWREPTGGAELPSRDLAATLADAAVPVSWQPALERSDSYSRWFSRTRAVSLWNARATRAYTAAELAEMRRSQERALRDHGMNVDYAAAHTTEKRLDYAVLDGTRTVRGVLDRRTPNAGSTWNPTVLTTAAGPVFVYWTEAMVAGKTEMRMETRFLDWTGKSRQKGSYVMASTKLGGALAFGAHDTLYLATSRAGKEDALLQVFDAPATLRKEIDISKPADFPAAAFEPIQCEDSMWLVGVETRSAHEDVVRALRVGPDGILEELETDPLTWPTELFHRYEGGGYSQPVRSLDLVCRGGVPVALYTQSGGSNDPTTFVLAEVLR